MPTSAYIHVPFCAHRCGYCNFTLVAGRDDLIDRYLQALEVELGWLEQPRPVETLFFGGGTPTHLPPQQLRRLLERALAWFPPLAGAEISMEANPVDTTVDKVAVMADHGVNRLSLGAQSFDAAKLRLFERDHTPQTIARAVELARPRMASISLDLIFAAPGETPDGWRLDLAEAVALQPDHVSTYGLTFERGTTFWGRRLRNELCEVDDDRQAGMYADAIDRLAAAGYAHYEVSNFARDGHRCRHNEVYWAASEYFAAGPGAARYIDGRREVNHKSTSTWLARVLAGRSPVAETETLSPEDRAREALVLGLRRIEGLDRADFARRHGYDIDALAGPELRRHIDRGLLAEDAGRLRLTRAGLLVSDSIWPYFLRV